MPPKETTSSYEIAPRPIRTVALEALEDIEKSAELFRKAKIEIDDSSRLDQARRILENAVETGELVPAHRGDTLGLRALELALDYAAIAHTLPSVRVAAVWRELRDSLVGPLDPPETSRGPAQLQSQAIVRAAFVSAGVVPTHPTHSVQRGKSSPDLILENGNQQYAIEAKRPQHAKNVLPRFEDACMQLADFGLKGGILVDVTDCLRSFEGSEIDAEVRRLAMRLYGHVFVDGRGHLPGYAHVMMAGTYARLAWNSKDEEEVATVNVHTSSSIAIFAQTKDSLADHRARWIRTSFEEGLNALSRTIAESRS